MLDRLVASVLQAALILGVMAVLVFGVVLAGAKEMALFGAIGVAAAILAVWLKKRTPRHVRKLLEKHNLR